jgi:hypothetical protein
MARFALRLVPFACDGGVCHGNPPAFGAQQDSESAKKLFPQPPRVERIRSMGNQIFATLGASRRSRLALTIF